MKRVNKDPFKIRKSRPVSKRLSVKTTPKVLKPKDVARMASQANALITAIHEVKPLYDELDEITLALVGQDLSKYGLIMVDNFASENKRFKGTFVSRFELKRTR